MTRYILYEFTNFKEIMNIYIIIIDIRILVNN